MCKKNIKKYYSNPQYFIKKFIVLSPHRLAIFIIRKTSPPVF